MWYCSNTLCFRGNVLSVELFLLMKNKINNNNDYSRYFINIY